MELPNLHEQGVKHVPSKKQKNLYYFEIFPEDTSIDYVDELDPTIQGAPYEEMLNMSSFKHHSINKPEEEYYSSRNLSHNSLRRHAEESPRSQPRKVIKVI